MTWLDGGEIAPVERVAEGSQQAFHEVDEAYIGHPGEVARLRPLVCGGVHRAHEREAPVERFGGRLDGVGLVFHAVTIHVGGDIRFAALARAARRPSRVVSFSILARTN